MMVGLEVVRSWKKEPMEGVRSLEMDDLVEVHS